MLDRARGDPEKYGDFKDVGITMLTIAVVAIIMTAPLGAILIATLGVKWLIKKEYKKGEEGQKQRMEELLKFFTKTELLRHHSFVGHCKLTIIQLIIT